MANAITQTPATNNPLTSLEAQLTKLTGVNVFLTDRGYLKFTAYGVGDQPQAAAKIERFLKVGLVGKPEYLYDSETNDWYLYFEVTPGK